LLFGALAVTGVPGPAVAHEAQQPSAKFSSSVDVVSVTAIVRDKKGRFVRDLDRDDFTVVEAGQAREILDFRAESDGPVKLALLFDISGSMRLGSRAMDARLAARQIFSSLRGDDQAAVFSFDTRLDRVTEFTSDVNRLEGSLANVEAPYGQTSLYDAIAQAARAVVEDGRGTGPLPQRRAVVVLTDGIDTGSRLSAEEVSGIASAIDVPVYVLAVMSSIDDPQRSEMRNADALGSTLASLSQWTGGELFTASAPAHANIAARKIVDELRHQYVLAFEASTRPGWRPVEIRAKDRGHIVRARSGYTAGGESEDERVTRFGIEATRGSVIVDGGQR
jgi:VWFA-related protein